MNGGGERSAKRSCENSKEKRPLGNIVVTENIVLIYSLKNRKTAKFFIYNLHVIPNLKKSLNIVSSVNFLVNLRKIHVIDRNIALHLIIIVAFSIALP
jgi:hypothetical protein